MNGRTTMNEICFCQPKMKTLPKETAINTYKKVHTGPNSHEGGDHDGLTNCEYQL